jgi:pimeloyl-ACP methyl ester carboxylesterase
MAFADVGDVRLFFTDDGAGTEPPILFVHGYACDSQDWNWQIPHFVSNHRVIALDLRGHGWSNAPKSGYDPPTFAADIAGLLQQLRCPPVVAVGHSLGGLIVSALAVEHPQTVRALVTVDPGYLVADSTIEAMAPLLAGLEVGDPVPTVQAMLGANDVPAAPPFLRSWHLRRAARVPKHVLVQTMRLMASGSEASSTRAAGERHLARRRCPVLSVNAEPSRIPVETRCSKTPIHVRSPGKGRLTGCTKSDRRRSTHSLNAGSSRSTSKAYRHDPVGISSSRQFR